VTVEYAPSMDGDPDPGEIVWAWVAYEEDPSQGKDRPVVVIGRRRSGAAAQMIGVPLTSKRDDRDPQVAVGTGPWDREGRQSYARLDRLVPLDANGVRREGAILARDRFDDVIAGLRGLHGGLIERAERPRTESRE
jgi:mRNA-degrading endonuclease toxin of MazEF toxin-antitoxin module